MAEIRVVSEVSGLVISIEAAVGARLEAFDPVLLVESMKMEIPVAAPRAGTISEILFAEGDLVSDGDVVAMLTT